MGSPVWMRIGAWSGSGCIVDFYLANGLAGWAGWLAGLAGLASLPLSYIFIKDTSTPRAQGAMLAPTWVAGPMLARAVRAHM